MESRLIGPKGPQVSAIGLGCMGMSEGYGSADEGEAIATIRRALDLGVSFLDTADIYGPHANEALVRRAIRPRRHLPTRGRGGSTVQRIDDGADRIVTR